MANNPILMSKLRHVLKLHCQGQNKLQISTATGLSRNDKEIHLFFYRFKDYLGRAEQVIR